jgi:hypothetical protein
VFGHSSPVYLMKFDTLNFFGTTMFGTKQTSTAIIGSTKFFSSIALNLSYRATHLSWSAGLVDLLSEYPFILCSKMI